MWILKPSEETKGLQHVKVGQKYRFVNLSHSSSENFLNI
jgi:hypothetical protein